MHNEATSVSAEENARVAYKIAVPSRDRGWHQGKLPDQRRLFTDVRNNQEKANRGEGEGVSADETWAKDASNDDRRHEGNRCGRDEAGGTSYHAATEAALLRHDA